MKDYLLKQAPNAGEQTWNATHPFYQSATVLAIDIGIEGIGLALRKGPQPLWTQTFEVSLPKAAPLEDRRLKRGGRRTRSSRRARDIQFKAWCVDFGLLTQEQADKLWKDQNRIEEEPAREANRVFDHRLRAVTTGVGVKLKEHCDAHQVPCDLVYPGAPNVKHTTDSDYIKAYLRPERK